MVSSSFSFTIFSSICPLTSSNIRSKAMWASSGLKSMAVTAKKLDMVREPKKARRLMGRFTPICRSQGWPSRYSS